MTEREYVETLRDAAMAYLELVEHWSDGHRIDPSVHPDVHGGIIRRWQHVKSMMSPATLIRLADAWLAKGEDVP